MNQIGETVETGETGETVETEMEGGRELPLLLEGYERSGAFHLAMGYGSSTQRFVLRDRALRPEGELLPFRTLHVAQWGDSVGFVTPSGLQVEGARPGFVAFPAAVQLAASAGRFLAVGSFARLDVLRLGAAGEASEACALGSVSFAEEISALAVWEREEDVVVGVGEWISGAVRILRFGKEGGERGERVEGALASTVKSMMFVEQNGELLLLTSLVTGEVAILQIRDDAWSIVKQVSLFRPPSHR